MTELNLAKFRPPFGYFEKFDLATLHPSGLLFPLMNQVQNSSEFYIREFMIGIHWHHLRILWSDLSPPSEDVAAADSFFSSSIIRD